MKIKPDSAPGPSGSGPVPVRALLLSVLALAVPVGISIAAPDWVREDVGVLIWLSALIPPFLLTYHRGWRGASLALAAGMTALTLAEVVRVTAVSSPLQEALLLWVVSSLIAVSLGAGALSELLHRARRDAEALALVDGLTGLPNRRYATIALESSFAAARRGVPLTVVLFDLDGFKAINDRHGHAAGDRVLVRFAALLAERTRDMNLSGRWGGEEFIAVLAHAGADGASRFAESVRQALEAAELATGRTTVSAGVAEYQEGMATPEVLVAAADQALYRAKEEGRNRVVIGGSFPARRAIPPSPPEPDIPVPEARSVASVAHEAPPRGAGEVVLVVDDDRDARRSVARALARFGYQVLEAAGAEEALEIVRGSEEPPDLLVTDVIMPSMSGFRLVEMLQEGGHSLRVLYMSGYAQEGVDWEGVPGSVTEFLSKPMPIEELARSVARLLTRKPERAAGDPVPGRGPAGSAAAGPLLRSALEEESGVSEARVLVVDDDPAAAESLSRILRRLGIGIVRPCTDAAEVPALVAGFQPDLVVLDLHMPGMDGIGVLQGLAPFLSGPSFVPVVMVTGDMDPEMRRKAMAAGASDFITKPPEIWELEARLRNLLRIRFTTQRLAVQTGQLEAQVAARTAELEEARTETLLRLARAAEYRDDLTGRHAERVGSLSFRLAEVLGLDERLRDLLHRAAPLHDVGKIGIPDAILRKPGPLDEAETLLMQRHTLMGAEILGGSRVPILSAAREIALHHHERWDGSGYPHGLAGIDIPMVARVVAVADVYDSLRHDRPYRTALPREQALVHLEEGAGTLFDADIAEALLHLDRSGDIDDLERSHLVGHPPHADRADVP